MQMHIYTFPWDLEEGYIFELYAIQVFRDWNNIRKTRLWLTTRLPRRRNLGCLIAVDLHEYYCFPE